MGPPKAFKTGAVAGTYPKPMLYLGFDRGGLDVIPSKTVAQPATDIKMNVCYEDIVFIKPNELRTWIVKPQSEQPKILAVDYNAGGSFDLALDFKPNANSMPFQNFINDYNAISTHLRGGKTLPWRTAVYDSITGLMDLIMSHISSFNPNALADARQWAAQVGGKVRQVVLSGTTWPTHVVFLMHSQVDKNELTGMVQEIPNVYSGLKNDIGGLFSQFFYATKSMNKPVIWTNDKGFVKGIGPRFPVGLPPECQPDFNSIYGKELEA